MIKIFLYYSKNVYSFGILSLWFNKIILLLLYVKSNKHKDYIVYLYNRI